MGKSILVIDDNVTVCLMLKSWLVKRGFSVDLATSVDQAKQLVKEHPFDLILSDIRMPDPMGLPCCPGQEVRYGYSGHYDDRLRDIETAVASMKSGAVDYIAKPIEPELLFKKIDEAFVTQENQKKSMLLSNDFVKPPGAHYKQLSWRLTVS